MINERLLYSIGDIADKYILEARPKTARAVKLFKRPAVIAAAITAFFLLCAFTVYTMAGDSWIQNPSKDPIKTVRSAIENQIKKEYGLKIEVESIEIDEAETARVIENFIRGELAQRRGWSDEYLAEHFMVIKAVYYAEYDRSKTYRADGYNIQYFYLTRDVKTGKWTVIDNSGDVSRPDENAGDNKTDISAQEQIMSYLSELFNKAYAPYYDGLHYVMTSYEETILDGKCTATFLWTMYYLGKGWDVGSDEGVEQQVNFWLQAAAAIIDGGELDLSTISILVDESAVGPPDYRTPVEEHFPNQLSD